jgi:uncharacterized protein (DUF2267 family)
MSTLAHSVFRGFAFMNTRRRTASLMRVKASRLAMRKDDYAGGKQLMSTGLAVFDTTVQETNEWLKSIEERLRPCDRQNAYAGLRATLHAMRDRLPVDAVLGLSAQLPMLVRGFFLEGWRPMGEISRIRDPEEFAAAVGRLLPPGFPREPEAVIKAVVAVLSERVSEHEARKLLQHLPVPLRTFWPDYLRAD